MEIPQQFSERHWEQATKPLPKPKACSNYHSEKQQGARISAEAAKQKLHIQV